MTRVEIIANRSVEPDLLEALQEAVPGISYTLWTGVLGRGGRGVRRGDSIWPERNVVAVLYVAEEDLVPIREALRLLKRTFPREGITMFELPQAREVSLDW